jgi:hypothetical protein
MGWSGGNLGLTPPHLARQDEDHVVHTAISPLSPPSQGGDMG